MDGVSRPFSRFIYTYAELVAAMNDRTADMQLSRLELDRIAGFQDGYAGKLLSKRPKKALGMKTLGDMLETLGLILMVVEDPAARDRTLSRRTPVKATNQRFGNSCNNPSTKEMNRLIAATSIDVAAANAEGAFAVLAKTPPEPVRPQPVSRAHLRVVQSKRK